MCELWLLLVFNIIIPAMQLSCEWMPQLGLETFWQKHEETRWTILLSNPLCQHHTQQQIQPKKEQQMILLRAKYMLALSSTLPQPPCSLTTFLVGLNARWSILFILDGTSEQSVYSHLQPDTCLQVIWQFQIVFWKGTSQRFPPPVQNF